MRLPFVLPALAALTVAGCSGKIVVTKVDPTKSAKMEGVYYALPKTVVKVDQPINRAERQAGKFVAYIRLFFPKVAEAGAYVRASGVKYDTGKAAISTFGEPDPNNMYYLKLKKNGPIDQTGLFEYTEQGSVAGVAAQADNATSDIIMSVIGTAASLTSKGFGASEEALKATQKLDCAKADVKTIPCKIKNLPGAAIDAERLLTTWARLTDNQQTAMQETADKNAQNFDEALAAYAEIYKLQTDRSNIRGNAQSFSADAAMKDYDAAIARELSSGFIGSERKDSWSYSTNLREFTDGGSVALLKLNKTEGVCSIAPLPASDRPPQPFWIYGASYLCDEKAIGAALQKQLTEINAQKPVDAEARDLVAARIKALPETLKNADTLSAKTSTDASAQMFQRLKRATQDGERGFYYRVPATANVVLTLADDMLVSSKQAIAQFGLIASLPASVGGRSTAYTLKFYEATGALKSFNVTSKAILSKGTADAVGANLNTLVDARNKANDELTKLDHDAKVLSNKVTIYNSCKTLNIACGGFVPASTPEE